MTKQEKIKKAKSYDELLDAEYGVIGSKERDEFEFNATLFMISEMLKDSRVKANLTQQQLAERSGTNINVISQLENGNYDIPLSTLYQIFNNGLGKHVNLSFS